MSITAKIKHALRGDLRLGSAALETVRRATLVLRERSERRELDNGRRDGQIVRLAPEFAHLNPGELLTHFRERTGPEFLASFAPSTETLRCQQRQSFPEDTAALLAAAQTIVAHHRWPLLGYGVLDFGEEIDWLRDPVQGGRWPLDYYADLELVKADSSDVRVLWELNRLGHLLTLGRGYAQTGDENFAREFCDQVESWRAQNPVGYGPNWACAMEAALRAMNLLAAFHFFRQSSALDQRCLTMMLALFDEHGHFVRRHLEFSYIATSNHYLSDVIGLLWLGIYLPELDAARHWRAFGLREMLRELDKQVLADGADCEASTGYHRFVTELFLYSFMLCRANGIAIADRYWERLRSMLEYMRAYLRPDGGAPLIGDADGGQVLPLVQRGADDHAFVLGVGAALFREPRFKIDERAPAELFWLLGPEGVRTYAALEKTSAPLATSAVFEHAGACVLREDDLYLLLSASGAGLSGRGSHGHNDALSIEVSACGTAFIVDPGSYVYTADLHERHLFRSTAYHSTVQVDGAEQNTTQAELPFILGDEAQPRILEWEIGPRLESIRAEHYGYERSSQPVTHQRRVVFDKQRRFWLLSDKLTGKGEHDFSFRFHFAPGLETSVRSGGLVAVCDKLSGARLLIMASEFKPGGAIRPVLEARFSSRAYGAKERSVSACWSVTKALPITVNFVIVPVRAGEAEGERLSLALESN